MRYLILVVLLAGCMTPEYRAERAIARHGPYCEKLGFQPNTDQWRGCILQADQASNAAGQAASQSILQNRAKTCSTIGGRTTCY